MGLMVLQVQQEQMELTERMEPLAQRVRTELSVLPAHQARTALTVPQALQAPRVLTVQMEQTVLRVQPALQVRTV